MSIATHSFDALMEITSRPPTVFVRGEGSLLWDDSGKRYLDFVQGWAVNCLGHSPPAIADALAAQAKLLLTQFPRGSQRGRHHARAQIRRPAQERRLRDHHLRRRFSRPHAGDDVGIRQEGV